MTTVGSYNGTNYLGKVFLDAGQGERNGKNFSSIIEYEGQYCFFVLNNNNSPSWWLEIRLVLPNGSKSQKCCFWTPVVLKAPIRCTIVSRAPLKIGEASNALKLTAECLLFVGLTGWFWSETLTRKRSATTVDSAFVHSSIKCWVRQG